MHSKYLFLNIQKTFVFLKVSLKKCFYRNDAGSLKPKTNFVIFRGGFKANC